MRDGLLLALGVAGALASGQLHRHEFFQYYLGAKYFRELGFTRPYACTTPVDLEAGWSGACSGAGYGIWRPTRSRAVAT